MKCLAQLTSVRSCCNVYTNRGNDRFWLASFLCCQKKSNNWSKSCFSFIFSVIAVRGLILRLKARELCSDADFKASLGWEKIIQNMWDLKRSQWIRRWRHLWQQNAWSSWKWQGGWVRDWQRRTRGWLKTSIVWSFHKQNSSFRSHHLNKATVMSQICVCR